MAKRIVSAKDVAFVYDFAVDGGGVSTINMGVFLPNNAVVEYGCAKVLTSDCCHG